jgi:hypothetical protein
LSSGYYAPTYDLGYGYPLGYTYPGYGLFGRRFR